MKKYLWALDSGDKNGLKGWIMDKDIPDLSVQINVFVDGNFLCNATANIFRQDLLNAKLGNGAHCFCVAIPGEFFDDKEHIFAFALSIMILNY